MTGFTTGSHISGIPEANDANIVIYKTDSGVMIRHTNSFINNCPTGLHSFRIFGTEGYFEHISQRGNKPETTAFSSRKFYGARKYTELPISFTPHDQTKNFGHGGADSYLWKIFLEALRKGETQAPIDLKAGLRMTLPGIYAAKSIENGSKTMTIHYPWDPDWGKMMKDE